MLSSVLVIVPFLAGIHAANDWSVACVTGECSYDIPTTNGSASGTMTIWGSQDGITDITTAADWQILSCDPTALSQDIRLVCMSDAADAKCSNLYQNTGAVNKIVRLPENPALLHELPTQSVSTDQSIPASISTRLVRRFGTQPQVQTLSLDTNFSAVDYSQNGPVNIAIQAANVPGAAGTIQIPPSRRATRLSQRALENFVGNAVSDIAANSVNVNKTIALPPLNLNKTVNIFNQSISCGPVTASVNVDLDGNTQATAQVGVAATGTLVPPKLTNFGIIAILNGNIAGTMDITADVAGEVDSGQITLVNLGVPGLDIPGILTANFDVNLDMKVGINLDLDNATLSFPPASGPAPNAKAFSIGDTPLTLSASPDVAATGNVTAHLIPSLNLGISALGNEASAKVFVSLDASATLQLNLDASANISTVIDDSSSSSTTSSDSDAETTVTVTETITDTVTKDIIITKTVNGSEMKETSLQTMYSAYTTTYAYNPAKTTVGQSTATPAPTQYSYNYKAPASYSRRATVTDSFGGCVEVDAGIDATAGADASFFGLFDPNVSTTLFSKNFTIFQKCFGAAAPTRRSLFSLSRLDRRSASLDRRAGLTCPASNIGSPASIVDEIVKAASIVTKA
ncbi:hypothetical protein B0H11DRAFT_2254861 [Mycena galericulata]|nr:hypothetical protein B0H11DRAFT_2254861 [Mycena galericulata]